MPQPKKNITVFIPIILMSLLALSAPLNITSADTGLSIAGLSTILGILCFFLFKIIRKQDRKAVGLNERTFLKDVGKAWPYILMPSILNIICVMISTRILPGYVDHVLGRTEVYLTVRTVSALAIQFLVFAFIEEISWRGFMQKQISLHMKPQMAIILTSLIFAIGHASAGDPKIVLYDVFFVFCNSIFYGLSYHKTNNIYASTLSHFIANFSGALILLLFF